MKKLIPCNSSQFKVYCEFTTFEGDSFTQDFYIPKTQKDEFLLRVFEMNHHIKRMIARSKKGVLIFDKTR